MIQLERAGEPLPTAQTELHLDSPAEVGVIRLRPEERRPAAAQADDDSDEST